ncbi:MAG TPA: hypothetical protein VIG62_24330, partial [Blastocatellia bacterium]
FFEYRHLINFALTNLIYTAGLLLCTLFLLEVGRRIGLRRIGVDAEGARAGFGTVEARSLRYWDCLSRFLLL